jgi:hypothetical protein
VLLPLAPAQNAWNRLWDFWLTIQSITSLVHLGVFVNHLHLRSERR